MSPRPTAHRPGYAAFPRWVVAPAALGALLVAVPVAATAARVPWDRYPALLGAPSAVAAVTLSLTTALASTVLCLILGVPLALLLARARFRGAAVLRALVLVPLVLPPVVGGIALLHTFGRQGLLGPALELLGLPVAFSTAAVVIAQVFVSLPFVVVSLEGALRSTGDRYTAVAATLGARPGTVLRRVTLPLLSPAVVSGAVLAFARSLGEFGATLTFAGSLEGVTRTLPLEIYLRRETDADAAVALSILLVAAAVFVVALTRRPLLGQALG